VKNVWFAVQSAAGRTPAGVIVSAVAVALGAAALLA
jgi:hypothetical protein